MRAEANLWPAVPRKLSCTGSATAKQRKEEREQQGLKSGQHIGNSYWCGFRAAAAFGCREKEENACEVCGSVVHSGMIHYNSHRRQFIDNSLIYFIPLSICAVSVSASPRFPSRSGFGLRPAAAAKGQDSRATRKHATTTDNTPYDTLLAACCGCREGCSRACALEREGADGAKAGRSTDFRPLPASRSCVLLYAVYGMGGR
jgi:hypothetical protein